MSRESAAAAVLLLILLLALGALAPAVAEAMLAADQVEVAP